MTKYGWKTEDEARKHVKVYDQDYHDLLADKDVEAVIIALPLHLHAPVAIEAMKAGKHVLTEKLMGHSVHECKEMARVSQQLNKILATGHQRHYSILYDNAVDTIRRGLIGEIHSIRAQWHRGNLPGHDSWSMPLPDEAMAKRIAKLKKELDQAKGLAIESKVSSLKKEFESARCTWSTSCRATWTNSRPATSTTTSRPRTTATKRSRWPTATAAAPWKSSFAGGCGTAPAAA